MYSKAKQRTLGRKREAIKNWAPVTCPQINLYACVNNCMTALEITNPLNKKY